MRISDTEVKKILDGSYDLVGEIDQLGEARQREEDQQLIESVTANVVAMPDREEMIASLKARIEAGEYNPSGEDIADAMMRRSIADRIKG